MERRSFFERYRPTNLTADPLPLKVLNHSIWKAEMLGHALDWASQYLHQKNCPSYLISPLLGKVLKEMSKADLSDCIGKTVGGRNADEVDADIVENIKYQPLRLMQSVTSKVDDICLRYKEENDQIETDFPNQSQQDDVVPQVYGASYHTIKNTRRTLEDRMVILPEIEKIFNLKTRASYFAVFDGHNGVDAAAYSAAHLHHHLVSSPDFPSDLSAAINYAFEATDTALLMKCKDEHIRSGTTVVIALIVPGNIYVAWAGDSQAVLVQNSQPVSLVSPHKPDREDEMRRIKGVGGEVVSVSGTWRVNGNLAVSRAIGNLDYKEYVTSTPEISHIEVNGSEEVLILACDGLWDVVSPQRSVEIVRNSILSDDPSDIDSVSQKLVIEAKRSGSGDNITVIVVLLKPKEELRKLYTAITMNGSTEEAAVEVVPAPVEVVPVPVEVVPEEVSTPPVSPSKAVPKSSAPSTPSKTSLSGSPGKSPTKSGAPTTARNSISMRSPSAQKAPAKVAERKPTSAKAPVPPVKVAVSATKTTVQKDGTGAPAKPLTQRGTTGTTARTQVAPRPATATKKPLKTEETDKTATTRSVVPPRPRPGTAPVSSRLTTSKAPVKQDASKAGEESATAAAKESATVVAKESATKRSGLSSARSTASKEGSVNARVTQPRPASSTVPKARVPSAPTARPASAAVGAPKPGSAAGPKPGVTTRAAPTKPPVAATTTSRPPLKKPVGPSATKKDPKMNGQTQPALAPKSSDKKITKKESGTAAGVTSKVNGVGKSGYLAKVINGVQSTEVEETIAQAETVKDVDASVSGGKENLDHALEQVSNGIEKQDVEITNEALKVGVADVTNENTDESEKAKEDHGKVSNGDIAYEDFMVTKPYAVDGAENVTDDQVKHDDNVKSEPEELEHVEKSATHLSESETVSTLELQSETPVEIEVSGSPEVIDLLQAQIETPEDLVEQPSPVPEVVDDVAPEEQGMVEESNQLVEDNISTSAHETSETPIHQTTDKDDGLISEDLISDRAQENGCLNEIEENITAEANENFTSDIPKDEDKDLSEKLIEDEAQQDHESLVVHDIPEEINAVPQEEQHAPVIDSFDLVEAPEVSAFPDTNVDFVPEPTAEQHLHPSDDSTGAALSTNPFADSDAEPGQKVFSDESFAESKHDDELDKDEVQHAVDAGEEGGKLEEPQGIEPEIEIAPASVESQDTEHFGSANQGIIESELEAVDHEQSQVADCELVRSSSETHTENFTYDNGAEDSVGSEKMQVLEASGIHSHDFMEDAKETAIEPSSQLELEPEKIEETLVNNEALTFEHDRIYSENEQGHEEISQDEILQSATKDTMDDHFPANTDALIDAFPLEYSEDLITRNTEFGSDPFASQFENQTAPEPVLDTNVVPDFGFQQEPFTTSKSQDELQSRQGLDQLLSEDDLLDGSQKFGNFELTQGDVTNLSEQENVDFVSEKNVFEEKPRHDQCFEDLDFGKMEPQPHETTVLLGNNPFLIDSPMTMSKGGGNSELINKNEMDVEFGFGNDNGIGSQLHSTSGGCVDTLLDINSSNCPGQDTEIMYNQTSSSEGGNHTGNLVESVGNEDNDALAILNR